MSMSRILLIILIILISRFCYSQDTIPSSLTKMYERANANIHADRAVSAVNTLDSIIAITGKKDAANNEFILKVLLKKAFATELGDNDTMAIHQYIEVLDLAEIKPYNNILAEAYIFIALLYEKNQRFDIALNYLDKSKSLIDKYNLESISPNYYTRRSSIFRVSRMSNDSALLYAQTSLDLAQKMNNTTRITSGHLLLGLLYAKTNFSKAKFHYNQTIHAYKKLKNYNSLVIMMTNMANLYLRNGYTDSAFLYIDSSKLIKEKYLKNSEDLNFMSIPLTLSNIYSHTGQYDSALYYYKRYHESENAYEEKKDIVGVEQENLKHNTAKNKRKIAEQAQKINEEKQVNYYRAVIITFLVLLFIILSYFYFRLKKAKNKTEQLSKKVHHINKDLSISLKQQKLLLSEVHHRVKNNLQIVISMLEWQADDAKDKPTKDSYKAMANRIYSIAAIHRMMYQKEMIEDIGLTQYIKNLCENIQGSVHITSMPQFDIQCPSLNLNLETLIPLGIMLNELITNSIKHASLPDRKLEIKISIKAKDNGYLLHFKDNGNGLPTKEEMDKSSSMGWYLIKSMPRQLQGSLEIKNDHGAIFNIFFREKINADLNKLIK
jgi:two-component system, sensor histidine kinase PdtaS